MFSIIQAKMNSSYYWEASGNTFLFPREIAFYRPSIPLLIPLIGVFIDKKIGWILIQSFFYFLLSNLVYTMKYIDYNDKEFVVVNMIICIPIVLVIILMNNKRVSEGFYGFLKSELISKNIIATIVGILMAAGVVWVKFYLY